MKPELSSASSSGAKSRVPEMVDFARAGALALVLVTVFLGTRCEAAVPGGYAGVGIGNANSTFDTEHRGFTQEDISPNRTAWRVLAGAMVNKYIGVEAGYIYLGKTHIEFFGEAFEAELTGFDVTPIGDLPFNKRFSIFARAGLVFWRSKMTFTPRVSPEAPWTETQTASNLAMGFGAKYDIARYLGIRAEYTRYAISKFKAGVGDYNCIWISGLFVFGSKH